MTIYGYGRPKQIGAYPVPSSYKFALGVYGGGDDRGPLGITVHVVAGLWGKRRFAACIARDDGQFTPGLLTPVA